MDLVARVQGILINPKEEWIKIKEETLPIPQIFTSYAMILAAIPAIAQFLGLAFIGRTGRPYTGWYKFGVGRAFFYAVFLYVGYLATAYVLGLVINALAPSFSSTQNRDNAMKLAVFSMTPSWIVGVLYLIPALSPLAILASLYGIYILYLGLMVPLMDTPKDKVIGYLVVSVIVGMVLMAIVSLILGGIFLVGAVGRVY